MQLSVLPCRLNFCPNNNTNIASITTSFICLLILPLSAHPTTSLQLLPSSFLTLLLLHAYLSLVSSYRSITHYLNPTIFCYVYDSKDRRSSLSLLFIIHCTLFLLLSSYLPCLPYIMLLPPKTRCSMPSFNYTMFQCFDPLYSILSLIPITIIIL